MTTTPGKFSDNSVWARFWSDQSTFDDEFLGHNVNVFLENSAGLMDYSAEDRILDIGCGPGHLLEALAPKVDKVCGVDVSSKYVRQCRSRLAGFRNAQVEQLGEDYTDLSILGEQRFTKIICLSVIQYYQEKNDVRRLMAAVKRVAEPKSRFLIADILVDTGLLEDVYSVLRTTFREHMFLQTVKFLWRAQFGQYADLRRKMGLLNFSGEELSEMARDENLESELIVKRLTVNDNRSHIMIWM